MDAEEQEAQRHERLQLAHAYRRQAEAQLNELEAAHGRGELDPVRYSVLHDYYTRHYTHAETLLNQLLAPERDRLASVQRRLEQLQQKQYQLRQEAASGRQPAQSVNDKNRSLEAEADALRTELVELQRLVDGAGVDVDEKDATQRPLREYERELAAAHPPRRAGEPKRGPIAPPFKAIGVGVAVAVVLGLAAYAMMYRGASIALDVRPGPAPGHFTVAIRNDGREAARCYVPAPEGNATGRALRMVVLVKEPGRPGFSPISGTDSGWREDGIPITGGDPIMLEPGLTTTLTFDGAAVRAAGANAERVRFEIRRGSGAVVAASEHAMDLE